MEKGESDTEKSFLVAVVWVAAGVGVGVVGGGGGGCTAVATMAKCENFGKCGVGIGMSVGCSLTGVHGVADGGWRWGAVVLFLLLL